MSEVDHAKLAAELRVELRNRKEDCAQLEAAIKRVRFLAEHGSVQITRDERWVRVSDLMHAIEED